ncbi:MAG: 3'-5' exonuclease [Anaerolineaceae bacterium]|nr:3'-5' exonuclease [Anaerolineaceae bacterium]
MKSLEENKAKLNSAAEKASTEAEEAKSEVKNFAEKARDIFEESKKAHAAAVSDIVKSAVDTEGTLFVELAASDKEAQEIKNGFVSIDVETTGIDAKSNDITAIAAVKYIDGIKVDAFYTDIKPSDVEESNDPDIKDALDKFFDFLKHDGKTLPIVTHFSRFAMNFLKRKSEENKIPVKASYFDICKLSKIIDPELEDRKLNTLSAHYKIEGHDSNDAVSDAAAVGEIFLKMTE